MTGIKKTAVMYGAGNIGRGFIGQVFHDSGFEVVFIDVNRDVVDSLNEYNSYTQVIVEDNNTENRKITGVRAVDGNDKEAVTREIAECEIMAVSLGAAVLPYISPIIANGLKLRTGSLNILVCENLIHAPDVLRKYISEHLDDYSVLNQVGFVGTTIGRMVPVIPESLRINDPTLIMVEKFCMLPIDRDAVVQPMPELEYTVPCSPFALEEGKKLYIHNMGHAISAYFGFLQGYNYIWQAMDDKIIHNRVNKAMTATSEALAGKYNADITGLYEYKDDLIRRFGNKGLGDTIARVGGDPLRKLSPGDRLIGAVDLCKEQKINYDPILSGIAAALKFNVPNDPSSDRLHGYIKNKGADEFTGTYCGLSKKDVKKVTRYYLNSPQFSLNNADLLLKST